MNREFAELPAQFDIWDESAEAFEGDPLLPFAVEEVLGRKAGEGRIGPVLHLWRHARAMVLGLRDRRLPQAEKAIEALRCGGTPVAVRHSGGAAVPLDAGVANVSFIGSVTNGQLVQHRDDFERMYRLIAGFVREEWAAEVDKGEVAGSYCPGDYDLSIGGKKFCGLSQRRQLRAVIAQAFILVEGGGAERAERAKRYYEAASGAQGGRPGADYPLVEPAVMASLSESLGRPVSAEQWRSRLVRYLIRRGGRTTSWAELAGADRPNWEREARSVLEQLRRRYDAEA